LIVPTRQRPRQLSHLLHSLAITATDPGDIEVVLVIDADDRESQALPFDRLPLKRVVVEPGQSMGALNTAGYEASAGAYLMLLNDDVTARTRQWDRKIARSMRRYADGIVLVHVNDTVFQDQLCTFPLLSRTFCTLAGGICPRAYMRYRIDDHIEDLFNLLAVLHERRTLYLPEVIFEHGNFVENMHGLRQYFSNEDILAHDAPRFEAFFPARKELALRLKKHITPSAGPGEIACWRQRLEQVRDSFALRVPGRQRVVASTGYRLRTRARQVVTLLSTAVERIQTCVRHKGIGGLVRAAGKHLIRPVPSTARARPGAAAPS
jgi:hypothetical protein